MIDNWFISIRTDLLTQFFKIIIYLTSDYSYIAIILFGYWMRPKSTLFKSLAFITPFSAVLGFLLKNIFQIPRPPLYLHLISAPDPFGFPSTDVLVSTVFWGTIFLHIKHFKFLCFIPVILLAMARIYVGVHSFNDIALGVVIGLIISYISHYFYFKALYQQLLIIALCSTVIFLNITSPMSLFSSIGILLGYGVSLFWIKEPVLSKNQKINIFMIGYFICGIAILKCLSFLPLADEKIVSIIRYGLFMIFSLATVPYLMKKQLK